MGKAVFLQDDVNDEYAVATSAFDCSCSCCFADRNLIAQSSQARVETM